MKPIVISILIALLVVGLGFYFLGKASAKYGEQVQQQNAQSASESVR